MFSEGCIITLNTQRGFGFIRIEGTTQDVFFHISQVPQPHATLHIGERVRFIVVEQDGKFEAVKIKRLDGPTQEPQVPQAQTKNTSTTIKWRPIMLVLGVLLIVAAGWGYTRYQDYRLAQQQKLQQLIDSQQQEILKQRAALGDLPDQVVIAPRAERVRPRDPEQPAAHTAATSQFRCDGRVHCSQMSSYDEAVYFLRHCPGTKMDGDGDGIPCERQFR